MKSSLSLLMFDNGMNNLLPRTERVTSDYPKEKKGKRKRKRTGKPEAAPHRFCRRKEPGAVRHACICKV